VNRDLVIYAQSETVPSGDDIVSEVNTRVGQVRWVQVAPRDGSFPWRRAYVEAADGRDDHIDVSTNPLGGDDRAYLAEVPNADAHRAGLTAARRQYFVTVVRSADRGTGDLSLEVARAIARRVTGVIHDPMSDWYFGPNDLESALDGPDRPQ
jgi:hypothetical protein